MPYFKGNDGNLLQHWVLCERLTLARKYTTRLAFVDAYSMAPVAIHRTEKRATRSGRFDAVFEHLPGQRSPFEQAWQAVSPERGTYPDSANFVLHLWRPPSVFSMLLCERDVQTVSLLRSWAVEHGNIEIPRGDWRSRFAWPLPKQDGLVFISFDPYMFNRRRCRKNPGNMYPYALDKVIEATRSYSGNVLLQLSTYSTNDDNSQDAVAECIRSRLAFGGFEEVAIVKPNASMMSLLYQRGVEFSTELVSLPWRLRRWFDAIERRA